MIIIGINNVDILVQNQFLKNFTLTNFQAIKLTALLPFKKISTRLPNKNFLNFEGKPLYKCMLDKLLKIKDIDRVVINTDAPELISVDKEYKFKVYIKNRKPELCGDEISMNLIIQDDIDSEASEYYLMTHTTNPLLQVNTIEKAIEIYKKAVVNEIADSLFTVNEIQSRFYDKNKQAINHDPKTLIPTQNLEPLYEENSNLYIFSKESFNKTNGRIGKDPLMMATSKLESIDIDDKDDWDLATLVASLTQ